MFRTVQQFGDGGVSIPLKSLSDLPTPTPQGAQGAQGLEVGYFANDANAMFLVCSQVSVSILLPVSPLFHLSFTSPSISLYVPLFHNIFLYLCFML